MKRASLRERLYWQRGGLETGGLTEGDGPGEGIRERKCMDGHIMGQAHNNSTRAQDEHMQHHHVKLYTHSDTCSIKNITHDENVRGGGNDYLSVAGPGGHQLDHI